MARNVSVGQITGSIRTRGDYDNIAGSSYDDAYMSTAFLLDVVSSAWAQTYDIIASVDIDRYLTTYDFQTEASQPTYDIPNDLYRLRGVDVQDGSKWYRIEPYEFAEREAFQNDVTGIPIAYRLERGSIRLAPNPSSARTIRLWYIQPADRFTEAGTIIDGIDGFEELIIQIGLRMCQIRAEESTTATDIEIAKQMDRVKQMSKDRDRGSPKRIIDPRSITNARRRRFGRTL
jgi:hypothetical protein